MQLTAVTVTLYTFSPTLQLKAATVPLCTVSPTLQLTAVTVPLYTVSPTLQLTAVTVPLYTVSPTLQLTAVTVPLYTVSPTLQLTAVTVTSYTAGVTILVLRLFHCTIVSYVPNISILQEGVSRVSTSTLKCVAADLWWLTQTLQCRSAITGVSLCLPGHRPYAGDTGFEFH